MKEIRELFEGMTAFEAVCEIVAWAGLFWLVFMLSVIGG